MRVSKNLIFLQCPPTYPNVAHVEWAGHDMDTCLHMSIYQHSFATKWENNATPRLVCLLVWDLGWTKVIRTLTFDRCGTGWSRHGPLFAHVHLPTWFCNLMGKQCNYKWRLTSIPVLVNSFILWGSFNRSYPCMENNWMTDE